MSHTTRKGFSLVELLIVVAVIGILAAVLVPNLLGARTRAFDTVTQACGMAIATAQTMYVTNGTSHTYAANPDALDPNVLATCDQGPIRISSRTAFDSPTGWTLTHPMPGTKEYVVGMTGVDVKPEEKAPPEPPRGPSRDRGNRVR